MIPVTRGSDTEKHFYGDLSKCNAYGTLGRVNDFEMSRMKVILLQDVDGLGKAGDIKEVKNGYGFNFLLPEGLAEFATPGSVRQAEKTIARRRSELQSMTEDFKAKAAGLTGKKVLIKTKSENGKLFGSVGREEIAAALSIMGIELDEKAILIDKPMKEIGTFPVEADFGHDAKASFEVTIESE